MQQKYEGHQNPKLDLNLESVLFPEEQISEAVLDIFYSKLLNPKNKLSFLWHDKEKLWEFLTIILFEYYQESKFISEITDNDERNFEVLRKILQEILEEELIVKEFQSLFPLLPPETLIKLTHIIVKIPESKAEIFTSLDSLRRLVLETPNFDLIDPEVLELARVGVEKLRDFALPDTETIKILESFYPDDLPASLRGFPIVSFEDLFGENPIPLPTNSNYTNGSGHFKTDYGLGPYTRTEKLIDVEFKYPQRVGCMPILAAKIINGFNFSNPKFTDTYTKISTFLREEMDFTVKKFTSDETEAERRLKKEKNDRDAELAYSGVVNDFCAILELFLKHKNQASSRKFVRLEIENRQLIGNYIFNKSHLSLSEVKSVIFKIREMVLQILEPTISNQHSFFKEFLKQKNLNDIEIFTAILFYAIHVLSKGNKDYEKQRKLSVQKFKQTSPLNFQGKVDSKSAYIALLNEFLFAGSLKGELSTKVILDVSDHKKRQLARNMVAPTDLHDLTGEIIEDFWNRNQDLTDPLQILEKFVSEFVIGDLNNFTS